MERRVLTLFVASPNDLVDERIALKEVVDRIDKVVGRRIGWHVDLTGWEDLRPAGMRPQDLINKDVDACDVFIGILSRRWGTPTGQYGSGFEEEFVRARDRRPNKPEIWLYFEALEDAERADPGEQLK